MIHAITPEKGTGDDRQAIQEAIDRASAGCGNVLINGGVWQLDGALTLPEQLHLHLDGAVLQYIGPKDGALLQNSGICLPRILSKYGRQNGITVTGSNASVLKGAGIYLYNVGDFRIEGLAFDCCCANAVTLVYCSHGRLQKLKIFSAGTGVEAAVGTRNCFFTDIAGTCADHLLSFTTRERSEMVYYVGPDVENHILRNLEGHTGKALLRMEGTNCRDIIVSSVVNKGEYEPCVEIDRANGISLCKITSGSVVNENHGCSRLHIQ